MRIYTNAYLDRNIGDDLMLKLAATAMPQHDFIVPFNNRVLFIPFEGFDNIKGGALPLNSKVDAENYDAFLTIGGSMYIIGSGKKIINRYNTFLKGVKRFKRCKKKIAVCGCNLDNLKSKYARFVLKKEIGYSGSVSVRDNLSKNLLKELNITSSCYPDILFSYPIKVPEKREGLGISVYRDVRISSRNYNYYKSIAEIADNYIEKTGKTVRLFAFDCEAENDLCAAYTIISMMKYKDNTKVIAYTGDADYVLERLSQCEVFIGTRFHSVVFSLSSKTPVIPVIYSEKTGSLLDDIEYPFERFNTISISDNIEKIKELTLCPEKLFVLEDEKLNEIKKLSKEHIKKLKDYFNN